MLEYKQERYRASEGRFDGNLNRMAARGWTVVSIDQFDGIYLVTFSRPKPMERMTEEVDDSDFDDRIAQRWKQGWSLDQTINAGRRVNEYSEGSASLFRLIWSRPAR